MLISILLLILSDSVPLIGAVFFRWDIFSIIFLYWLESSVIGLFNVAKMITIIHHNPNRRFVHYGLILFFLFHFGVFMLIHGSFLTFFGLVNFAGFKSVFGIVVAYSSMIISHGASFYTNFITKKEFLHTSLTQQMFQPYGRVVVMHLSILFGGFLLTKASSMGTIILLVVMKTIVDLFSHLKEHSGLALEKPMTPQQLGQTITQMKAEGKTNEEITQHFLNNTVE